MLGSRFYVNPDREVERSILVAGTARSGTTWLADMIASQISCRIMFEPFNPNLVPDYNTFHYFHYLRPSTENQKYFDFAHSVFSGSIRNRWIDRQNEQIFPKYRLIKEIRANLSLKWLHENFPAVPMLFIIRHPCAVVLSRMQLRWATDQDLESFLLQKDLISDHLSDHLYLLKNLKTDEEKHAAIWSISNLIPLKQFLPGELKIISYEDLCIQPEKELVSIFEAVHQKFDQSLLKTVNRPSMTTKASNALLTGMERVSNWKTALSSTQIENILRIVKTFGLECLYDDSLMPLNTEY